MVYNIARYGAFMNAARELECGENRRVGGLVAPLLLLLVFFFIGYLAAGVSGIADLMMASIRFEGGVFVFLLLIMFRIVGRLEDADRMPAGRYEDVRAQLAPSPRTPWRPSS